jgi:hypothetical protein
MAREHLPPRGGAHQQVGRYQILSHIASGGMGAVYLAFDPVLNRNVALKVMSPDMAARPHMVQRFQREAKAAAKLKHENIVQIFDCGEAAGIFYLALEFVDGTDLEDYIEQRSGGRLEVDETIAIGIQAAKALDHAYSQDIVHRDIKPSNFLVTTKGGKLFIKLTDMGLARAADDARITRDNTTLGTVEYISPEQARDSGSADTRSDLYSLGCSIFHMLVGHAPFHKGTLIEKVQHHLSTPPPDVRAHRSDVSDHLAAVLLKLLAKDPVERYETPLHLLHDLMSKAEFEAYLKDTQELVRPVFRPPAHTKQPIAATVQLPVEELLPPPDPLFPADFRVAKEQTVVLPPEPPSAPPPPAPPVVQTPPLATVPPPPARAAAVTPELPANKAVKATQVTRTPPREKVNRALEAPQPKAKAEPKKPRNRPRSPSPAAQERLRRLEKRHIWRSPLWIGGIVGGLLFAAFGVWAVTLLFHRPAPPLPKIDLDLIADEPKQAVESVAKVESPKPKPIAVKPVIDPSAQPPPVEAGKVGPETPAAKLLTKSVDKIDGAALEREVAGPHGEFPKPPSDAAVFRVNRGAPAQADSFAAFADAWREAGKRTSVILEIHDRGPLAIPSLPPLGAAHVTIRPAAGQRPLLIWDKKPGDKATTWMPLERGSLIAEDVDLLVRDDVDETFACFTLSAGDASVRNINFFQADQAKGSVAFLRIAGRGAPGLAKATDKGNLVGAEAPQLARLENCFVRGPGVMAAHITGANSDLLVDRSLIVGQRQPAILILGQGSDIANVRSLRSTIASSKAIIHYQPTEGQAIAPRLGLFGLDSLLTNPGPDAPGALVSFDESVGTSGLTSKIANSAFAGWPVLLRARQTKITTLEGWRSQWGHRDGDAALTDNWPPVPDDDFDRVAALNCSPLASALAFASTKSDALVGCPVGLLPSAPAPWRLLPPAALPAAALELPEAIAPDIVPGGDDLYHGEIIDLSKIADLGDYLGAKKLASRVVVHLIGRGTFKSSPLRLFGTNLVLYASPEAAPTLEFQAPPGSGAAALLDVDKGSFDLINLRLRADWRKPADVPAAFIRVHDGSLSLARCVVQTPLTKVPADFRSLIVAQSETGPAKFTCRDCVFLSGASFVTLEGPAAVMRSNQSLILALDDAVVLKPGPLEAPLAVSARFDHNTIVVKEAFLRVQSVPKSNDCFPPMAIHAFSNYFSSLAPGGSALLLRSEGDVLGRGLVAWHGQANAFDLSAFPRAVAWNRDVHATPFPQAWFDLWGHAAEDDPLLLPAKQPAPRGLNLDQPIFDRYVLPNTLRLDLPGAHLQQLLPLIAAPKKK